VNLWLAALLLAQSLCARVVVADEPPSSALRPEHAQVVFVGAAARNSDLQARVDELLKRDGIDARYSERAVFAPRELLGAAPADAVSVFVVLDTASAVHLY